MKLLLEELEIPIQEPMELFCDNKATILIIHNRIHHDHTKHVEVDRQFIKEKIDKVIIGLKYIIISDQTADLHAEALYKTMFAKLVKQARNVQCVHSNLRGGLTDVSLLEALIC